MERDKEIGKTFSDLLTSLTEQINENNGWKKLWSDVGDYTACTYLGEIT